MAGEEGRYEHAHDVDEDGDGRLGFVEAAHHDGKWRGRHHERHHTEGDHGAGARHQVGGLGHNFEQRTLRPPRIFRFHHRELDEAQHEEDDGVDHNGGTEARLERRQPEIGREARHAGA